MPFASFKATECIPMTWCLRRGPRTTCMRVPWYLLSKEMSGPPHIHWLRITVSSFVVFKCSFSRVDEISLWWKVALQTYYIFQPFSELGTHIFRANFLSLCLVTTREGLFVRVPWELVGEQCWEWLVRVPGRPEVWGGEACGARRGRSQEYTVHGIRFSAEVVFARGVEFKYLMEQRREMRFK